MRAVARFYLKNIITDVKGHIGKMSVPVEFIWDDKSSTVLFSYPNVEGGIMITADL